MATQIMLDSGICEISRYEPSYAQVFEYASWADPIGFLTWMAARADDVRLEDLVEEYARAEAKSIDAYFSVCQIWREK